MRERKLLRAAPGNAAGPGHPAGGGPAWAGAGAAGPKGPFPPQTAWDWHFSSSYLQYLWEHEACRSLSGCSFSQLPGWSVLTLVTDMSSSLSHASATMPETTRVVSTPAPRSKPLHPLYLLVRRMSAKKTREQTYVKCQFPLTASRPHVWDVLAWKLAIHLFWVSFWAPGNSLAGHTAPRSSSSHCQITPWGAPGARLHRPASLLRYSPQSGLLPPH